MHQLAPDRCGIAGKTTSGARLRKVVLDSLEDRRDQSLEDLKEHAHGFELITAGASGQSLNITLVNPRREDLVMRL